MDLSLFTRDVVSDVTSAPQTFSSWDNCMAKSYCKWPAIIGIVIGSLIVLSVLFCIVQCLCCGYSCMQALCCCCKCGRGGSRRRDRSSRYKDDYAHMPPTPYSGYQPTPNPMTYNGPSTAAFDVSRKVNEDSLPAMPSWDNARTHRFEDHSQPQHNPAEDLEMGRLGPPQQQLQRMSGGSGYNQVPNGPTSPMSPTYGAAPGYFNSQSPMHQNSDLGAQRMGARQTYNDFEQTPLSPAPTYHSTVPNANTDRFAPGAASPLPYQYQDRRTQSPPSGSGYAPSGSTRYEATDYAQSSYHTPQQHFSPPSTSPPPLGVGRPPSFGNSNQYNTYSGQQATSPKEVRPPSLLQIGRRAVPGSTREV